MAIARVVICSLVAHVALFAALGSIERRSRAKTATRAPIVELVEPAVTLVPAEIEVVLVPPETPPAKRPARRQAPSIATTTKPRHDELVPSATAPEPVSGTTPSTTPRGSMSMRVRGTGPDLVLHEDVPHEKKPVEGEAKPGESRLHQSGAEYVAPDLVTTMHVSRDGRARFVDKPDIEVKVTIPRPPSAKQIGDHLAGWYRDPYAQKNARRVQDMPMHEQAVPGGWDAGAGGDTNINGSIKPPEQMPGPTDGTVPLIGGKLDITSWLHRKFIGDPYASRKRALLDGTHAERARIRERYNREQLDDSAITMQKNVERVFRELRDPADRRAALFALWDECVEGEGSAGEAGARARAIVIGAIRGRLSGPPDGFTVEEIAALDARRTSAQHFAPYAD
jgi:hypothetical protein